MATETEEQQAKEFLKRAEIRTMKKDLSALREVDSLKERNKIAHIKTLEEQQAEHQKQLEAQEAAQRQTQKAGMQEVLQKNEKQEYAAEKDLKNYATEQERQQIFLFETQRFELEKEAEKIDKEKDPALKLEKNKLLLEIQTWQAKLNSILEQEKKLEDEQKVIMQKEQTSAIPSEKKGLEQRRSELDKEIQEVEKKRWGVEKQIQDLEGKISQTDKSSELLVADKNTLRDKILGIDKSLREIYSAVMAREEDRKRGLLEEQKSQRQAAEKRRADENEKVQRQQWTGKGETKGKGFLNNAPDSLKGKLAKSAQAEEEARKKFLQDVSQAADKERDQNQQKSNIQ